MCVRQSAPVVNVVDLIKTFKLYSNKPILTHIRPYRVCLIVVHTSVAFRWSRRPHRPSLTVPLNTPRIQNVRGLLERVTQLRKKEGGRRKKEEGRRKKEERRMKKEGGRMKKEEVYVWIG